MRLMCMNVTFQFSAFVFGCLFLSKYIAVLQVCWLVLPKIYNLVEGAMYNLSFLLLSLVFLQFEPE